MKGLAAVISLPVHGWPLVPFTSMRTWTGAAAAIVAMWIGGVSLMAGASSTDSTQPAGPATTQPLATAPDPSLSPADVVRAVVEALRTNDEHDSGIRTTWQFASPSNKQVTGPLDHFIPLVKNPIYLPLLNDRLVVYQPARVQGEQAQEVVAITEYSGDKAVYVFQLSRQADGPLKGCWMTDGVVRLRSPLQPGQPGMPPDGSGPSGNLPV